MEITEITNKQGNETHIPGDDQVVGLIAKGAHAYRMTRGPTRIGEARRRGDLARVGLAETVDRLDAERVVGPAR